MLRMDNAARPPGSDGGAHRQPSALILSLPESLKHRRGVRPSARWDCDRDDDIFELRHAGGPMSRVDELRDDGRRPSDPALAMEHSSTASARDVSPAPSNRQLLHSDAVTERAVTADTTAPISPRLSHARALRSTLRSDEHARALRSTSRSNESNPNLVEFGLRDPENPLHFSFRKKMLIFAVRRLSVRLR